MTILPVQEESLEQTFPGNHSLDSSPSLNPVPDTDVLDCCSIPTLLPSTHEAFAELSRLKSSLSKHQTLVLVGTIAWCLSALQPVRRRDWELLGKELPERVLELCWQLDSESLLLVLASASQSLLASTWLADRACPSVID